MPLRLLPCWDSDEMAAERRRELDLHPAWGAELGRSAVEIARSGWMPNAVGDRVELEDLVTAACSRVVSLPPEADLPDPPRELFDETTVQVRNQTTLAAARELVDQGSQPLALNFANGLQPGGGFLTGACAQEETLCRSSALFLTLVDDRMYAAHRKRPRADSTDWAILSPEVPVFREDDGTPLDRPWTLCCLTCAAPYAPDVGQPEAGDLLQARIHRVLAIARAFRYQSLVLGAWGCGAFEHDPVRTAKDFRSALEGDFAGAFREVIFAIADWSRERRYLGPFRDVFGGRGTRR